MHRLLVLFAFVTSAMPAMAKTAAELVEMASKPNSEFRAALIATMGEEAIMKGTAVYSHGPSFIFAVEAAKAPVLFIDGEPAGKMRRVKGWDMWFLTTQLETGRSHSFYYLTGGRKKGGDNDVPAYLPECYAKPDVPRGSLSEKLVHTSKIYEGMITDYWIYVPAQYDPAKPAALMVWQDGQSHIERDGKAKTLNVVDNLIHEGKIPVMIQVFVAPGSVGEKRMRSYEYDRVDDTYARFLRDELLPEVDKKYAIRKDSYSRAIAGVSSGAICAFNAAWHQPDQFSRVLSLIGSYTSIAWNHGDAEAGDVYPFRVRKGEVRNIRVWLQDGSVDLENDHGSWPLQNIQMANSLKLKGYDFHFSWGDGSHDTAHGSAELPRSLAWLWRDYDPARTEQVFQIDPEESKKPMFRVKALNR